MGVAALRSTRDPPTRGSETQPRPADAGDDAAVAATPSRRGTGCGRHRRGGTPYASWSCDLHLTCPRFASTESAIFARPVFLLFPRRGLLHLHPDDCGVDRLPGTPLH